MPTKRQTIKELNRDNVRAAFTRIGSQELAVLGALIYKMGVGDELDLGLVKLKMEPGKRVKCTCIDVDESYIYGLFCTED